MALQDMDLDDFTAFESGAVIPNTFNSAYYNSKMNISSSISINMGTTSLQDLHVHDPFTSTSNSITFTNLTFPSTYNEPLEYKDSFDVLPFIGNGDLDYSLSSDPINKQIDAFQLNGAPLLPEEELKVSEAVRVFASSAQCQSGTNASSPSGSRSSLSSAFTRKGDKPLRPIIIEDSNDTVAIKRSRNTLAARKYRQRMMQQFDELEARIVKLKIERDYWKEIATG